MKPIVTFKMESGATVKAELYPDIAPNTVYNFIALVKDKFYDGLTFHRIVPKFIIQGGSPDDSGKGGPGWFIRGEFAHNDFPNKLKHNKGILSMARTPDPDSAGSQFFIVTHRSPHLDKYYAAFGKVIEGMDEVERISQLPRDDKDRPLERCVIASVTVDTQGREYPEPEKIFDGLPPEKE